MLKLITLEKIGFNNSIKLNDLLIMKRTRGLYELFLATALKVDILILVVLMDFSMT